MSPSRAAQALVRGRGGDRCQLLGQVVHHRPRHRHRILQEHPLVPNNPDPDSDVHPVRIALDCAITFRSKLSRKKNFSMSDSDGTSMNGM